VVSRSRQTEENRKGQILRLIWRGKKKRPEKTPLKREGEKGQRDLRPFVSTNKKKKEKEKGLIPSWRKKDTGPVLAGGELFRPLDSVLSKKKKKSASFLVEKRTTASDTQKRGRCITDSKKKGKVSHGTSERRRRTPTAP